MSEKTLAKTIRLLTAAEGYLELNMADYALEELEAIEDPGSFEPLVHFMKGEALKSQQRFEEAIDSLRQAAQMIPAPHNKMAWMSLSECFRQGGRDELADVVEMFANSPVVEQPEAPIVPTLNVSITIQPPIDVVNRGNFAF